MTGVTGTVALAVLGSAFLGAGIWLLRRATRLERLLEDHDRDEADLKALAGAFREDKACGCHWVPCDKHVDRLLRVIRKDSEPQ